MSRFSKDILVELEPVLSVARRVLAERRPDEIPHRVRSVVQSSARRLPPPLARSLLLELEESEQLRSDVLDAARDLTAVARAYLERSDGWWVAMADAVAARTAARTVDQAAAMSRDVERLQRFAEEADERRRDAEAMAVAAEQTARRQVDELRRRLHQERQPTDAADRDETVVSLERQVDELETHLAEMRETYHAQRERTRRQRRQRDDVSTTGGSSSLPSEPIAMARALDHHLEVAVRTTAVPDVVERSRGVSPPLRLPDGVAPDGPDALQWLLRAPSATVIVDGYNVLFRTQSAGSAPGLARHRLDAALRRLHLQSSGRHSIVVVYDSTVTGERGAADRTQGVAVRFAAQDSIADDEIVDLASSLEGQPVVVISSDRDVRERAAATGAVVLWSEALSGLLTV